MEKQEKIIFRHENKKNRLHHQHKNWERNHRDYGSKIIKKMERGTIVDRIISKERLVPYLQHHENAILEGIEWLDKGMLDWIGELNHVDQTIEKYRNTIK